MAGKAVATEGDVSATVGAKPYQEGWSGTWTAGAVNVVSYAHLTVGGTKVISEASCGFSFSGVDTKTQAPVQSPGPQELKLAPQEVTVLQQGDARVLRDGDTATDQWGNTLTVASQNVLTSE